MNKPVNENEKLKQYDNGNKHIVELLKYHAQNAYAYRNYQNADYESKGITPNHFHCYRVDTITYEKNAPSREAIENVISAMRIPGFNLVYILMSDGLKVNLYIGVSKDLYSVKSNINAADIAKTVLTPALNANFRGCELKENDPDDVAEINDFISNRSHRMCIFEGVPGIVRDEERFQSMDRLADSLLGMKYAIVTIASPCSNSDIDEIRLRLESLITEFSPYSANSHQISENTQHGSSVNEPANKQNQKDTPPAQYNSSFSVGESVSYELSNKYLQNWIKYIEESLMPRLDYGRSKGLFYCCSYAVAENDLDLIRLENNYISVYSGKQSNNVPLSFTELKDLKKTSPFHSLTNFQIPHIKDTSSAGTSRYYEPLFSRYSPAGHSRLGNWYSAGELSLVAGMPYREIKGVTLQQEVEFGLNPPVPTEPLELGRLVYGGSIMPDIVALDQTSLNKHVFVTGVTGSGKTTTCQNILKQSGLPFLVIEPAKNEYRSMCSDMEDVLVFTLGKNSPTDSAPFRLNPFEFFKGENITSHIDMIKACLEAAFTMDAAIPQLMEAAIYRCYENCGWDVNTNQYTKKDDPYSKHSKAFPLLSEVIEMVNTVVDEQHFDERLKNDYIGSIRARLQSLTLGAKGQMLNTRHSVNLNMLLERNVILELEDVKSAEEKTFIMGIIMLSLNEAIKCRHKINSGFRHITLVEEAHRLLTKFMPGDSPNKRNGTEVFANMLSEIREYGESLIIADQIPEKLIPEVLKNTNTKIVHRLFAADDKEAVGNTMSLSNEQKEFLSKLKTGRAVVFSQDYVNAVQVQMNDIRTGKRKFSDYQVYERAMSFYYETSREFFGTKKPDNKRVYHYITDSERAFDCLRFLAVDYNKDNMQDADRTALYESSAATLVEYIRKVGVTDDQLVQSFCQELLMEPTSNAQKEMKAFIGFIKSNPRLCNTSTEKDFKDLRNSIKGYIKQ